MESQGEEGGSVPTFQDGVAATLMASEELRQKLTTGSLRSEACLTIREGMEDVMELLFSLTPRDDIERDLRQHCHQKAADVALQVLNCVITKEEKDPEESNVELERDCQGAIARIAELNLVLHQDKEATVTNIIDTYAKYQRKVLRLRSKPCIARLVAYRQRETPIVGEEEDDEENSKSQHSHVITTILGQASSLIHPLIMWKSNLPDDLKNLNKLCSEAIHRLDQQAQDLTKTVAEWCFEDRKIDEWMAKSANETPCQNDTAVLDALVDELSFSCQVFDRYISLLDEHSQEKTIRDLHPEWTWKYAALERYLTTQQTSSALKLAKPVQIVLGTQIQVPSVVEDAQYLSTRALERAASTRSTQAIGTVAHSIANDVWSTDLDGGVHQALVEQRGCWEEPKSLEPPAKDAKPSSNSFAQALMGALDEDLSTDGTASRANQQVSPPPTSGSFLGSLSSLGSGNKFQQIRLDTHICALNGLHSASTACSSLVEFLDSLLPTEEIEHDEKQAVSMIHLAREELFRFSRNYQSLMRDQVSRVVREFCGSVADAPVYKGSLCLPVLRYYLEREDYELPNASELQKAEDDARLHRLVLVPLEESRLLQQFEKCDADVLKVICEELTTGLVDLFLECIHSNAIPKRVTDWGSLLLSKQVRLLQNYLTTLMEKASDHPIPTLPQWERLSQAVTILQLEKPSDWSYYQSTSVLSPEQVEQTMRLRVDFSKEAVAAVVAATTNRLP
eukprot:scaffold925_cov129-Cylindrotheca_fusiformis.AAC.35